MNENKDTKLAKLDNELGTVEIAPEVIEVIAGIAASEVDGIAEMKGSFASGALEKLGKKSHGKGVRVEVGNSGVQIDVYCVVNFGVSIPVVAEKLQTSIRETLINMTALVATEVNVHIVGIQFEQEKSAVETDHA